MTKQKIIFLKGLPASGKSTWSKEYIKNNPNTIRVNKDELRYMQGVQFSKENEELTLAAQRSIVVYALKNGRDVIIDNTHLMQRHEDEYSQLAVDAEVDFEIKSFLDVPVRECVERDRKRTGREHVGENVILSMAKKAGLLVGGFSMTDEREFAVVPIDKSLPPAIIVDIDGTIANSNGRNPYDFRKVGEDLVHEDIKELIEAYIRGCGEFGENVELIIVSGRGEECRKETEAWLNDKFLLPFHSLHMRKLDDRRKDSQVKYEILLDLAKQFNILFSIDDRDQVVKMWREAGVRCLQVADGNF